MKRYKIEQNGKLDVGQVLYTKHFALTLDRNLCKGCELCKIVCPREAISLTPVKGADGKAAPPLVDIDENKCDFHGICAVACPFAAINITTNGINELPAVAKEAFPSLIRDINVDSKKCKTGCRKCEETCPLNIISVSEAEDGTREVNIQKELCAGCQICWLECPEDAIEVTKFIEGSIGIDAGKCEDGCKQCLNACPVDAIALDGDGKVYAKDINCVYCGACLQVCPNPGALRIERTAIRHTPINSGAWNKGLEKLTSRAGLTRELGAANTGKARKALEGLEVLEGLENSDNSESTEVNG